jgi:manganese/zinc/iron transport system substrate-binding protein
MVADIVQAVAGDKGQVQSLIGEGVDPHLFKPTRADVARLAEADVVFYSGHLLEGKMTDVLVKISSQRPVHAVTEAVDPSYVLEPSEFAGHADPHMWMDVQGWMAAVNAVKDALGKFDPANQDLYQRNAATYLEQLKQLDDYARKAFASVPQEKRVLVTAHDAFNYMGRAYGLEVRGIQGLSTESEAGLADLNALVNFLVERKIEAVFVETSVAEKNVKALIEGARAKGSKVRIGGQLYSDAMGPAGTYEGTYIGMIDHNVTVIVRALGGQAPATGMQGKLTVGVGS